jgi:hypothetical protein
VGVVLLLFLSLFLFLFLFLSGFEEEREEEKEEEFDAWRCKGCSDSTHQFHPRALGFGEVTTRVGTPETTVFTRGGAGAEASTADVEPTAGAAGA